MKNRTNRWTTSGEHHAVILFYQGFSTQEISTYLEKSAQAVDKKLNRLKAKPPLDRHNYYTVIRYAPFNLERAEISDLIKAVKKQIDYQESLDVVALIDRLISFYPLKVTAKPPEKPVESDALPSQDCQWKSLVDICAFLNRNHIYPKRITNAQLQQLGYTHAIEGKYRSPGWLLAKANEINQKNNKDRFFLDDYTDS